MRVENRTGARLNGKLGTLYDVDVFCDTIVARILTLLRVNERALETVGKITLGSRRVRSIRVFGFSTPPARGKQTPSPEDHEHSQL